MSTTLDAVKKKKEVLRSLGLQDPRTLGHRESSPGLRDSRVPYSRASGLHDSRTPELQGSTPELEDSRIPGLQGSRSSDLEISRAPGFQDPRASGFDRRYWQKCQIFKFLIFSKKLSLNLRFGQNITDITLRTYPELIFEVVVPFLKNFENLKILTFWTTFWPLRRSGGKGKCQQLWTGSEKYESS